jgi:hypothetical protein
MNPLTSEATLESNITECLSQSGGYKIIKGKNIDRQTAIDTETVSLCDGSTIAGA